MEVNPPEEISFKVSGQPTKNTITIKNTLENKVIAFKVKTTAPNYFVVRPNSGKIDPGETLKVTILLQLPSKEKLDSKRKDKFLVQGIKIQPELSSNDEYNQKIALLWSQADQAKKSGDNTVLETFLDHKLRCVYFEETATESTTGTPHLLVNDPTKLRAVSFTGGDRSSVYNMASNDEEPKQHHTIQGKYVSLTEQVAIPEIVTNKDTNSNVSNNSASAEKKLQESAAKIQALETVVQSYKQEVERLKDLRQRKADTVVPTISQTNTHVQRPIVQGLELKFVLVMCFVSFLLGIWLF